jgi:hypothetical protein
MAIETFTWCPRINPEQEVSSEHAKHSLAMVMRRFPAMGSIRARKVDSGVYGERNLYHCDKSLSGQAWWGESISVDATA